ncbi:MAG: hypothetical protein GX542_09185 [Rhodococcus sp.]|nr:hypothetical protein [Rhodococcus sp. (in: high G+C Gram-positive bacteria)]
MNRSQMIHDLNKQYVEHALGETTLLHDDKLIEPTLAALNVRRNDGPGQAGQPAYVVLGPNGDPISAAISETALGDGLTVREIASTITANREAMLADHAELVRLAQSGTGGGSAPELQYRPGRPLADRMVDFTDLTPDEQQAAREALAVQREAQQRLNQIIANARRRREAKAKAETAERERRAAQMQRLGQKRPVIRPHFTAPSIEDAKPDAYEPEF